MTIQNSYKFKNSFYLNRYITRQRPHSHGTPGPYAMLLPKNLGEKLTAPIDHFRVVVKIRRRIHHPKQFDDSSNPVQRSEMFPQSRQNRQPHLPRRRMPLLQRQIRPDTPPNQGAVDTHRPVPGNVGKPLNDKQRPVNRHRFWSRGKLKLQSRKSMFVCHKGEDGRIKRIQNDHELGAQPVIHSALYYH